jgi:hypothetical protein
VSWDERADVYRTSETHTSNGVYTDHKLVMRAERSAARIRDRSDERRLV